MGNSNRVSFVPGGARGERLCSAQLDGPGTATVKGRGAGDGLYAQPWLPKACLGQVGLLDFGSAEAAARGGTEHGLLQAWAGRRRHSDAPHRLEAGAGGGPGGA